MIKIFLSSMYSISIKVAIFLTLSVFAYIIVSKLLTIIGNFIGKIFDKITGKFFNLNDYFYMKEFETKEMYNNKFNFINFRRNLINEKQVIWTVIIIALFFSLFSLISSVSEVIFQEKFNISYIQQQEKQIFSDEIQSRNMQEQEEKAKQVREKQFQEIEVKKQQIRAQIANLNTEYSVQRDNLSKVSEWQFLRTAQERENQIRTINNNMREIEEAIRVSNIRLEELENMNI